MTFKAVVDFFDAPAFGQSAEKLFGPGSAAAVENTLFGIEHASLLIKIASCGTPGTSFTSWQNLPRSARRGELGPRPVRRESVLFFLLSVTVLCQ